MKRWEEGVHGSGGRRGGEELWEGVESCCFIHQHIHTYGTRL